MSLKDLAKKYGKMTRSFTYVCYGKEYLVQQYEFTGPLSDIPGGLHNILTKEGEDVPEDEAMLVLMDMMEHGEVPLKAAKGDEK